MENQPRRYALQVKAFDEYLVVDTNNDNRLLAICSHVDDANHVVNALNFNYKPLDYGYKMVDDE